MATIVTRAAKGSPLTSAELDQNQINLNTDKAELSGATFTGAITANAGVVVDNITIDGNEINVSSGDLTLDCAGDLVFDSDGGLIEFKDGGTRFGRFTRANSNLELQSMENSGDILLRGKDSGGNNVTALTLDMGNAGAATFNSSVASDTFLNASGNLNILSTNSVLIKFDSDGNQTDREFNIQSNNSTQLFKIDENGAMTHNGTASFAGAITIPDKIIHAGDTNTFLSFNAADQIQLVTGGVERVAFYNSETHFNDGGTDVDFIVESNGNANMLFVDGGSNRVGIGHSAPEAVLDIVGNSDSVPALKIGPNANFGFKVFDSSTNGDLIIKREVSGTDTEVLRLARSDGAASFNSSVTANPSGGVVTLGANGHITSKQSLDVATAGGRYIGSSNRGLLGQLRIEQTAQGADGGYVALDTCAVGSTSPTERFRISSDGSLSTPTAGTANVRFGVNAGNSIASGGNYNTVVGDEAGTAITTGAQNTFIGAFSGDATTDADYNVGVGIGSLGANTVGSKSTAIGTNTLFTQNPSSAADMFNTAMGYHAGFAVSTGVQNTLIGGRAGDALQDADFNTAIGFQTLSTDTLGSRSTAVGFEALRTQNFTSATDAYNTALGFQAGAVVSTGVQNTIVGGLAGDALVDGTQNVLLGYKTGTHATNLVDGIGNVLLGNLACTTTTNSVYANVIGFDVAGAGGFTTLGSGTSDIRAQHGVATWATVSDERYKKDIVDATAGLSFINALQPRTFKYKNLGELPETFSAYEADSTKVFKNSNTNHGFIAQEVKAAIDADSSIKDGFRLWDDRDDGSQEVAEAALIPVLTKAIQELSAQVDALTARIETLEG